MMPELTANDRQLALLEARRISREIVSTIIGRLTDAEAHDAVAVGEANIEAAMLSAMTSVGDVSDMELVIRENASNRAVKQVGF